MGLRKANADLEIGSIKIQFCFPFFFLYLFSKLTNAEEVMLDTNFFLLKENQQRNVFWLVLACSSTRNCALSIIEHVAIAEWSGKSFNIILMWIKCASAFIVHTFKP